MDWWYIPVGVASAVVGMFAFRIGVTFDVNRWQEDSRKRQEQRLKNLCPHVDISDNGDGRFLVQVLFVKPRGIFQYCCTRCGLVVESPTAEDAQRYWSNTKNFKQYAESMKRFSRLAKKMGLV